MIFFVVYFSVLIGNIFSFFPENILQFHVNFGKIKKNISKCHLPKFLPSKLSVEKPLSGSMEIPQT